MARSLFEVQPSHLRCAVVTGVSRPTGIGRCIVHSFLSQGYRVVGTDCRDFEPHPQQHANTDAYLWSDRFQFIQADVSDSKQAQAVIRQAVQWFDNKLHVLVNNAAKTVNARGADRIKHFEDTIATNLNGAFYLSEYAIPYLVHGESSIIHISSTRALQSEPDNEAYSASKAALIGLTHAQAIALADKVRVNAILPGWINTDLRGEEAVTQKDHKWHPVGRVGVPKDVAEMCLFLCNEEHAGFITGQQFVVDGGVTKKMVYPD